MNRQGSLFSPTELVKVPDTGWKMPREYPRLDAAKIIGVDTETYDPGISAGKGPGVRLGGYIAGISIATEDNNKWYFPIRHACGPNLDPKQTLRWLNDKVLNNPKQVKVGANLLYDLDYLAHEGVTVTGALEDVQIAQPLLDEHQRSYALGMLAKEHRVGVKNDEELNKWCAAAFGGKPTRIAQAKNYWRAPATLVGPYAEDDAMLPIEIIKKQWARLHQEDLIDIFQVECGLIPLLLAMRRRGVRVDLERAGELQDVLKQRIIADQNILDDLAKTHVNVGSGPDLEKVYRSAGIAHEYTSMGNPSFPKWWLEQRAKSKCKISQAILDVRKWSKFKGTFVDGYIFGSHVDGRIHTQFHQMKSDDGGTVSGRFSSSTPNLQNIPARDPELGPMVRGLFLPEEGEIWEKADYSQIEYRLCLHYASGEDADEARAQYQSDPTTDFHQLVAEIVGIPRRPAKTINFGLLYGMGNEALAAQLNLPLHKAVELAGQYHNRLPFAKKLLEDVDKVASNRGWIRTIGGRRCRFPYWQPDRWPGDNEGSASSTSTSGRRWNGKLIQDARSR